MADLTAPAPLRILGPLYTEKWAIDTSTANQFYRGGGVMLDVSADTVNATPYVDGIAVVAADVALGIAADTVLAPSGGAETIDCNGVTAIVGPTIVGFKSAVFTNADVGKKVYLSESGTLSATKTANLQIGKLLKVADGYAFVTLDTPRISDDVT